MTDELVEKLADAFWFEVLENDDGTFTLYCLEKPQETFPDRDAAYAKRDCLNATAALDAVRETHHLIPLATVDDGELVGRSAEVRSELWAALIGNDQSHKDLIDRIEALTAEKERLRTHLAAVRDEVLEEAAKVADCFHERALEWAKSVRGLTEHLTETDSSRIATTIRAMKGDGK